MVKRKFEPLTFWAIMLVHGAALLGLIYGWMSYDRLVPFAWWIWLTAGVMYAVNLIGISVGYHRYFMHHSFACKKEWFKWKLAIFGGMAAQSTIARWKSWHELHHARADREGDPHRPSEFAAPPGAPLITRFWCGLKGFNWAHWGWTWHEVKWPANWRPTVYREDLKVIAWQNRHFGKLVVVGYAIPTFACAGIGSLFAGWGGSLRYGLEALFLAGFIRHVVSWHATWSVNSFGHFLGFRSKKLEKKIRNRSRNQPVVATVAPIGEGWHQNHHGQPDCACFGWKWYQPDPGWWYICFAEWQGWVDNVVRPLPENLAMT